MQALSGWTRSWPAATQKRLRSSTPVRTFSSAPCASITPPITSICHSCSQDSYHAKRGGDLAGVCRRSPKVLSEVE